MKDNTATRDPASIAVTALRQALGMTQQRFAVEVLKTSITTVARYETTHPPRGAVLLRLAKIAKQHDLADLAARFGKVHLDELLLDLGFNLLVDKEPKEGWLIVRLRGQKQIDRAIEFVEEFRTSPNDEPAWTAWKKHVGYRGKERRRR